MSRSFILVVVVESRPDPLVSLEAVGLFERDDKDEFQAVKHHGFDRDRSAGAQTEGSSDGAGDRKTAGAIKASELHRAQYLMGFATRPSIGPPGRANQG